MITVIHAGVGYPRKCRPIDVATVDDVGTVKFSFPVEHHSNMYNGPNAPRRDFKQIQAARWKFPEVGTAIRESGRTVNSAKNYDAIQYDGSVKLIKEKSGKYTLQCFELTAFCPYVEYTFDKSETPEDSNPLEYKQKWALIKSFRKRKTTLDADTTKLLSGFPEISGRDRVFRKFCDHFSYEYERFVHWFNKHLEFPTANPGDNASITEDATGYRVKIGEECEYTFFVNAGKQHKRLLTDKTAKEGLPFFNPDCSADVSLLKLTYLPERGSTPRTGVVHLARGKLRCEYAIGDKTVAFAVYSGPTLQTNSFISSRQSKVVGEYNYGDWIRSAEGICEELRWMNSYYYSFSQEDVLARVEDDGTRVTLDIRDGCSVQLFINAMKVQRHVVKNADAGLTHFTGCAEPRLGWDLPFDIQKNSVHHIELSGTPRAEIKCYTLPTSDEMEESLFATYGDAKFEGLRGVWVIESDGSWVEYPSSEPPNDRIKDAVGICETLWAMKEWFYNHSEPPKY